MISNSFKNKVTLKLFPYKSHTHTYIYIYIYIYTYIYVCVCVCVNQLDLTLNNSQGWYTIKPNILT